jgi:hypothetical protein
MAWFVRDAEIKELSEKVERWRVEEAAARSADPNP